MKNVKMTEKKTNAHVPVLLNEVIDYLDITSGSVILDGTLGGGGHTRECLKKIGPKGCVIGIDKDSSAIERVKRTLKEFNGRIIYVNDDFRNIVQILKSVEIEKLDGAIFDFGMSSFQIDEAERGFSFLKDGPLDMRMDSRQKLSAKEVVNKFSKEVLSDIIKEYGEERHAKLAAAAIVRARKKKNIETTMELVSVIKGALGRKYNRQKISAAARTFQALRIYVNDELKAAEAAVKNTIRFLNPGARITVISFHSLEDRIVKNIFRETAKTGEMKIITKKPVCPGQDEIARNPRSRSAKLRVAERV
ncbi:MAG: 16S rRNA (cytosine(1402)-N(4))-methyltransferase RsmH [Candidatus Omnitrophota bacterium]